jgi:hypothetical protein
MSRLNDKDEFSYIWGVGQWGGEVSVSGQLLHVITTFLHRLCTNNSISQ